MQIQKPQQRHDLKLAAGSVTGIGSLPFKTVDSAIHAVAKYSSQIPFWPQLPQRSSLEDAIAQHAGLLGDLITPHVSGTGYEVRPGRVDAVLHLLQGSDGSLNEQNAGGFFAFEKALRAGQFVNAEYVKGQLEGPITLAAHLFYRGKPFLADPTLFAFVAYHVAQMANWQISRMKVADLPVMLFVDEPALCLGSLNETAVCEETKLSALAAILTAIRNAGAIAGLHCCAAGPFARMCRVSPDILSFDAYQNIECFFTDADALTFVRSGGYVAYGLIPTRQRLEGASASGIFARWLVLASMVGDPQEMASRAMITATCGLGLLDSQSVQESFELAHRVGRLFGRLAGVEDDAASTLVHSLEWS